MLGAPTTVKVRLPMFSQHIYQRIIDNRAHSCQCLCSGVGLDATKIICKLFSVSVGPTCACLRGCVIASVCVRVCVCVCVRACALRACMRVFACVRVWVHAYMSISTERHSG